MSGLKTDDKILVWHFVGEKLQDGRSIPADGEILTSLDKQSLYASERLMDALSCASRRTLCRVECWGDVEQETTYSLAARHRRILWRIDTEQVLRAFVRRCALDVVHLWDAPDVVKEYLKTGNEVLRSATMEASMVAKDVAVSDATKLAAWVAGWVAERAVEGATTPSTAQDVARAVAGIAARFAVKGTMCAARSAARDAQNTLLTEMVETEHKRITGEIA